MPNTTNYNWATPADTDLVKDGAAAIRTLGSSADTTVKNLNPGTTAGDIDYYTSSTAKARVAIGTAGQVLRVNSGGTAPEWATTADQTPLTTKGDLFGFDTADARIPIGTNGHILTADSTQALGLKWAAPVTGSMTLLHTLTLNATSTTQSTISQAYKNLYIVGKNIGVTSGGAAIRIRFAGRTSDYQGTRIEQANITALSASGVDSATNDLSSTNGSAFNFTCFDYAETSSEKLITGQTVGNNTGTTCFYNISPFNLQTNIASVTITTVAGTATMSGTVEIYGVN